MVAVALNPAINELLVLSCYIIPHDHHITEMLQQVTTDLYLKVNVLKNLRLLYRKQGIIIVLIALGLSLQSTSNSVKRSIMLSLCCSDEIFETLGSGSSQEASVYCLTYWKVLFWLLHA